jgi:hypothetical protein
MHYRTVLALLFAYAVALSYSAGPWQGVVKKDSPLNFTFSAINFQELSKLSVTTTLPVSVCFVYANYTLPRYTEYSEENCLVYHNASMPTNDYDDTILIYEAYTVGVYLAFTPDNDVINTTVHVSLTGAECPSFDVFGPSCTPTIIIDNSTFLHDLTQGEDAYFTYTAPDHDGMVVGKLVFSARTETGGFVDVQDFLLYARYMGTPSALVNDAIDSANGTIIVDSPRRGSWIFYVHAMANGTYMFSVEEHLCSAGTAGSDCHLQIEPAFNNMSLTITPERGVRYLRFRSTPQQGLLVSVTALNSTNIPFIYASRYQIPVLGKDVIADVRNCNRDYCSVVRSIAHNTTAEEDWYIVVDASVAGNTTYGLWFNTTCVPNCVEDSHGSCLDSGLCDCELDFEGIDCSISKGLGPQYIVLIIIASLVVASAIIGFVAWAYMRRKRANYEIVS